MLTISNRSKIIYLVLLILFISAMGLLWIDYIGLVDLGGYLDRYRRQPESVLNATGDEPSLFEREEFEKEKQKLQERIEDLDKREAMIVEKEKRIDTEREKLDEMRKGLDLSLRKFDQEKKKYSGYSKNVKDLSQKIVSMPPEESVKIMVNWEDTLIIDVLRQIDADARAAGRMSISSYLITLMPKEKASRIMYLMTQL